MRSLQHLLLFIFLVGFVPPAHGADEFGARFSNAAPAALSDSPGNAAIAEDEATALQDIMPAAGDENADEDSVAEPQELPDPEAAFDASQQ